MTGIHTRPMIRMALFTAPVIAATMVTPLFIVSRLEMVFFWLMLLAVSLLTCVSWAMQIFLLRFRDRFGRFPWIQILISSAVLIAFSLVIFYIIKPPIPTWADRLPLVRYVNVVVVNIIIYILIHLRLLSETKAKLVAENANLKFANLEKQYKLLKEQVNPHFLFNALGTAKSLVRRDPVLAENYIVRLSDFLRAGLSESPDLVSMKDELKLVRDYVELQQMRFRDALVVNIDIPPASMPLQIPFFSLLTLVENAIKHNAMTTDHPLQIDIRQDGEWVEVRNNLHAKPVREKSNGSGLQNLRERNRLLGYADLNISQENGFFSVKINLNRTAHA